MIKWDRLLQALNQTFNTRTGATSKVKPLQRTFDNATQEHVIWLDYRVKADIFDVESTAQGVTKLEKRKRLIDVLTESSWGDTC